MPNFGRYDLLLRQWQERNAQRVNNFLAYLEDPRCCTSSVFNLFTRDGTRPKEPEPVGIK